MRIPVKHIRSRPSRTLRRLETQQCYELCETRRPPLFARTLPLHQGPRLKPPVILWRCIDRFPPCVRHHSIWPWRRRESWSPIAWRRPRNMHRRRRRWHNKSSRRAERIGDLQGTLLQASSFFILLTGVWHFSSGSPSLNTQISRIPVRSERCKVYATYTQILYHLGH